MPAKVANPRKQYQYQIFIPGINPFLCQKVKLPDDESDVVEHGDTGYLVKTAGLRKIGMLTVEKLKPSTGTDVAVRAWRNLITNFQTGGGELPIIYKQPIIVEQFGPDFITVVERWEYHDCWPQKLNGLEFDRKSSDNSLESIEFCIDTFVP